MAGMSIGLPQSTAEHARLEEAAAGAHRGVAGDLRQRTSLGNGARGLQRRR